MADGNILLEVKGLKKYFPVQKSFLSRTKGYLKAVDDVSLHIRQGETLGLVGESGCGKTTLGRCILRLYEPTGGDVLIRNNGSMTSLMALERKAIRAFRRHMQIIFQDPYSSLNPRMTILEIIGEPLLVNGIASGKELEDRVKEMLVQVGLSVEHLRRYPHSFSGGQRQRIGIARALVVNPKLVVADEPVSALDVSIQAQILNLLKDLQDRLGLTYLFISHDLSVVRYVSDRIGVMYMGKLVEIGPKKDILTTPKHPYTEALLSAVPKISLHSSSKRIVLPGELPDATNLPPGCVLHPRCRYAEEICKTEIPTLKQTEPNHYTSCHLAESLCLRGISA